MLGTITVDGGSTLNGNLAAGQQLIVEGNAAISYSELKLPASFTNAGTLTLTSSSSAYFARLRATSGTITNTGTINIETGTGGERYIEPDVINSHVVSIGAGVTANLAGNYTQTTSGTLKLAYPGLEPRLAERVAARRNSPAACS